MAAAQKDRNYYFDKVKTYQETINRLLKQEKTALALIREGGDKAAMKQIALVEDTINLSSCYIILNGISQSMLGTRNEDALNESRKSLSKSIILMEELVSNYVDAPFSDYEDKLAVLEFMDAAQRYLLIRKLGFAVHFLEYAYGDNTKWRWIFVDLEGRYTAVAKNIFDLKAAVTNTDPRSPAYEPSKLHLRLIKKLLRHAADRFRQKYELSTNRMDDFVQGINFLNSLRRIHILLGEREEGEQIKKQLDIWSAKLDMDMRKVEAPPPRV